MTGFGDTVLEEIKDETVDQTAIIEGKEDAKDDLLESAVTVLTEIV